MNASITASELKSALAGREPPLLIDVRRAPAFRAAPDMAAGALRRDPGVVGEWVKTLPRAASVITYCVHGHEVSQNAAKALREAGLTARFLELSYTRTPSRSSTQILSCAESSLMRRVSRSANP